MKEYYVINRAADRLEQALTVIEDLARPGDVVVVSPRIFVRPLAAGGAEVLYLTDHLSDDELDGLVENHRHTWVLTSSYLPPASLQEPADQWLQSWGDRFVRVPIKSITALAYGAPATADREVVLLDRITMLEAMAAGSSGRYEAWQRYGLLAEAYQALGDLYAGQGQAALAEEYWTKAEEARAAAPPP